ncbi:MAG: sugar-binding transcriptional regulator [Tissierellia bacterium]|nr:sugar-binding transcriptional regulator [Tissierellia bacterium]
MDLIELEKRIVPEMFKLMEMRYDILRSIYYNQPIGRRGLANDLNIGERTVRTEVNILKEQGLLNIESMGMYLTEDGKKVIEDLKDVIHRLKGISQLEDRLEELLGVDRAIIVPGDLDESKLTLMDMGKASSIYLKKSIRDNFIIGITGGTTMARVAEEISWGRVADDVLVIPARGGLGKDVETQSNSIVGKLAKRLGGDYRLLHVPDNLDKNTLDAILKIPDVREVIELIGRMDILIFGIGRADIMATRRQLPEDQIERLIEKGAVAEAFGHYFDIEGNEIWEHPTVGLSLDDFRMVDRVIGVAGGSNKAEAIISISSLRRNMTIITDEGAAKRIIEIVDKAIY